MIKKIFYFVSIYSLSSIFSGNLFANTLVYISPTKYQSIYSINDKTTELQALDRLDPDAVVIVTQDDPRVVKKREFNLHGPDKIYSTFVTVQNGISLMTSVRLLKQYIIEKLLPSPLPIKNIEYIGLVNGGDD